MLRANLSSRPFYNERLVSAGIALVAVAAVALTLFNVYRIHGLSKQRAVLRAAIARDTALAQQIERGAVTLQQNVDRATLVQLAGSTQEANTLIDERTFSWTVFFGLIERTLPIDLHLVAVAPRVERGNIRVTMSVVGRALEDIDTFVDALQDTGSFYDLLARNKERDEDENTYRADVVGYYLAPDRPAPANKPRKPSSEIGRERP